MGKTDALPIELSRRPALGGEMGESVIAMVLHFFPLANFTMSKVWRE